jgi:SAM-dependent methyltransferase
VIRILKGQPQIEASRKGLVQRGLDSSQGWRRAIFRFFYTIRFRKKPEHVAINKSWDVFTILNEVEKYFPDKKIKIYDMGSFNSEMPIVLWNAGYHHITASDFNPMGRSIRWYGNRINFQCEDFYKPDIPPNSLDVITAVSVIEHGFDEDKILKTFSNLLKKGGVVFLTTDFRDPKTSIPEDFTLYGLSYMIFCKSEITRLVESAAKFGLKLLGESDWQMAEYPIDFLNHKFTFIFVAFQKA